MQIIRKPIVGIVLVLSLLINCSKDSNTTNADTCNLDTPISNTAWIIQIINGTDCSLHKGANLSTCSYKNKTWVYLDNLASSQLICNQALYSCNGEKILDGISSDSSWNDFKNNMTNKTIFWIKP